jgi:peptidyl-prolyl cis-trans isomerase C
MVLFFLSLAAPACGNLGEESNTKSNQPESSTTDNGVVASVNDGVISLSQFENSLAYQLEIAAIRGVPVTDGQLPALKYQVLENLINQELLYQESRQQGIEIEETEVDDAFAERKKKANFKSDDEFEKALIESNKSMTSYREEIKRGMAIDRFVDEKITAFATVSDSEARTYYDANPAQFQQPARVRVSHIMISVAAGADQSQKKEARKKIENVMERMAAGEEFASLAEEVSEDADSKGNGGDLGYFFRGQTPPSFEDAAFSLKPGEISDVVETDGGYHIIKLTDRKDAGTISYEDAENDIINHLKTAKVKNRVEAYIIELKLTSTIVTYPLF